MKIISSHTLIIIFINNSRIPLNYIVQDGKIGKEFNEYQVELGNLICDITKKYNDVLDGNIGEDDLWLTIRQVREKITEGKDFITNKKSIQELENIVINLATLKKQLRDANLAGDESEASKFRNQFLQFVQRYNDNVLDFEEKLKQAQLVLQSSSQTAEIISQSVSSQTAEIISQSVSSQTAEIISQSVSSQTAEIISQSVSSPDISTSVGKKAIVIGINKYESLPDGKNLQGAENDANEIHNILKKNGFEITENDFLLGEKATYRAISKSINNTFRKRINYGTILFYFSGHGFADENKDVYIAPYDVDPDDPYVCGISIDELNRVMDNSTNNSKFVTILDCCYAGKALEATKGLSEGLITLDDSFKKIGSSVNVDKNKPVHSSKIILASSQADQSAHEKIFEHEGASHHHGIFSYYLIEGLLGKANPSAEGDITPDKIYKYVKEQMKSDGSQIIRYGAQVQQDGISIALASYGEKDKEIKEIFEQANDSMYTNEFPLLIYAAKELWLLEDAKLKPYLNVSQKYEYDTIRKKLNNSFHQYGNDLYNWFIENETQYARLLFTKIFKESRKNIYSELRTLCENLTYEVVAKITDQEKRCLMAVFHFINSSKSEDEKLEELEREIKRLA
jgi:hypothetical protein